MSLWRLEDGLKTAFRIDREWRVMTSFFTRNGVGGSHGWRRWKLFLHEIDGASGCPLNEKSADFFDYGRDQQIVIRPF